MPFDFRNLHPHATMPRDDLLKGRHSQINQPYHVTICTENRQPWFGELTCGRILVKQMRRLHEHGNVESLAWVIMPDHLHWLFQLGKADSLSHTIKHLKAVTAIEMNTYLQRKGTVWQRGFYDHAMRKEEDIKRIARYIVANPLRAGLVENIGDYPLWDAAWL